MGSNIIAYDLGTGGSKASLYNDKGQCLASTFVSYETYYSQAGWHEQKPMDWWNAIVKSTQQLLNKTDIEPDNIECLAISGHSLGAVPIDKDGELLRELTPIWSDTRAKKQVQRFFVKVDKKKWYETTGNGFPAECYSVFKIMWYKDNEPDLYKNAYKIIGTKDFINYKMTGKIATDYSYASGCGAYDLKKWNYSEEYISASELNRSIFPDIVPSTEIIGNLTNEASKILGLSETVKVVCGGVDNSCMALGAKNIREGRVYTSLGSSAWIAVSSQKPIVDFESKPFVFTHVIPGMFTSAVSIFSAGSSYAWVKNNICKNLQDSKDPYGDMGELAAKSPVGANKLIFNPSLAGGTSLDVSSNIRGAYMGLDLLHTQADLIRAAMEGIAMNLKLNLDVLKSFCEIEDDILFVGGGSKSKLWRQIFADVFDTKISKTNIDQDAGSLGAAAIAAVGTGMWKSFDEIDNIHIVEDVSYPNTENYAKYKKILPIFKYAAEADAKICDMLFSID